jgi:flavin reductase (DIM6/NTAB) family NADH-FMN oxidoreductase RutF
MTRDRTTGMDGAHPPTTAEFDPAAHPRLFRQALGQFATGVTVVTTRGPHGPLGITANSFASVSLDPPLVLWSPARGSSRFPAFSAASHFAVHVLTADQRGLADGFTRAGGFEPPDGWQTGPHGLPLIDGALATFLCQTHARHDGGDHEIVVGRVLQALRGPEAPPLVFQAGAYRGIIAP